MANVTATDNSDGEVLYAHVKGILTAARSSAYKAVNFAMVRAYWEVGKSIVEMQGGEGRSDYGDGLIDTLAKRLVGEFGSGFNKRNLHYMRQFYVAFPIVNALRSQLTWTHYRAISRVADGGARLWYMNEAADQGWSTRTLERNISTQYYHRLLASQGEGKAHVQNEMERLTAFFEAQHGEPSGGGDADE